MKTFKLLTILAIALLALPVAAQPSRWLGGDISLLPTYEERGTVYRTADGEALSALQLFKDAGWNMMRVRLFVDPQNAPDGHKDEGVCQDLDYVIRLSRQIKEAGFALMLDFHYSDTWADPGKQFTPLRWQQATALQLADSVYHYTVSALRTMHAAGISPEMIQVGNEITFGTLWPTAKTLPTKNKNWNKLAAILQAGCKACREECPEAKIIIHTEHAYDWKATKGFYQRLRKYHVDYDIIGLSYYPMWHKDIATLGQTLDRLATTFPDKPVMIVETAYYYSHDNDRWEPDPTHYADLYPVTPEGQRLFTQELVSELRRHDNTTGLFWWFAEENESGPKVICSWINRGLFDNHTGKELPALQELRRFLP